MRKLTNILITGGCGFIGTNFIRYLLNQTDFKGKIINLDKLTYAGNIENLKNIEHLFPERYQFVKGDICDKKIVEDIFANHNIDTVVHFAAESHVDRSIYGPAEFIQTNIIGTFTLLEVAKKQWGDKADVLFHHISTDEVYGSLGETGYFYEDTAYDPRSPYSASKSGADHLVSAYFHTYGLPITISNCSNNYGPYQFPEKLIPLMILNMLEEKPLPIYGDGKNIRDWLFVEDHCAGIWQILKNGKTGETYNIGGDNEWKNLDLVSTLCEVAANETGKGEDYYKNLITFIKDRPGHDRRYAINCEKIKKELGWKQTVDFKEGLKKTIHWYLSNVDWVNSVRSGAYKNWIEKNYGER